jgi:HD-GYP domain-containing protein (c-di-GMP phosphodiesterase class II)
VEQVNAYAQAMAADLGWSESQREALEFGAILHDIGKIHIRESTLLKTGPLDPDEWEEMRKHPIIGARMIEGIPYLTPAIPLVLHHHERWDGDGYPEGLEGEQIPIEARLLAVVDTFHAMTSDRPYRKPIAPDKVFQEIKELSGKQFDPKMVESFARCWERKIIQKVHADMQSQLQKAG